MAERPRSAGKLVTLAVALAAFWTTAPVNAQSVAPSLAQRPPTAEKMAKTFGLNSFGQVEGIRYTFNVELPAATFPEIGNGTQIPTQSPMRGNEGVGTLGGSAMNVGAPLGC